MPYELSTKAAHKLDAIIASLRAYAGEEIAERKLRDFEQQFERIAHMPRIGRLRRGLGEDLRSINFDKYVIAYGIADDDRVSITGIYTGSEARGFLLDDSH